MMCIGWRASDRCGRMEQVTVPAGQQCPSIMWFYTGLAAVVLAAFTNKS
jgi:hypothetical protein